MSTRFVTSTHESFSHVVGDRLYRVFPNYGWFTICRDVILSGQRCLEDGLTYQEAILHGNEEVYYVTPTGCYDGAVIDGDPNVWDMMRIPPKYRMLDPVFRDLFDVLRSVLQAERCEATWLVLVERGAVAA